MRLTQRLFFYVKRKKIPGKIDSGKHQLVKPVTISKKKVAAVQLVVEQENLDILQHAWLTEAEETAYIKRQEELGIPEKLRQEEINKTTAERMFKHTSLIDFLGHLNTTKKWE